MQQYEKLHINDENLIQVIFLYSKLLINNIILLMLILTL